MKEKLFNIIQIGDKSNRVSRGFDIFITITILSNILVTFLQTFEQLRALFPVFKGDAGENTKELMEILKNYE